MIEIWVDIKGYEGLYQISNLGTVRSNDRCVPHNKKDPLKNYDRHIKGQIIRTNLSKGYKILHLYKNGISKCIKLHRLIAEHFIPNPCNKPVINHINGIKTDNRIENLEWVNQRENLSNGHLRIKKTSKYIGVCWTEPNKRWKANIKINSKTKHLGYFDTEEEASKAYHNALKENRLENSYA